METRDAKKKLREVTKVYLTQLIKTQNDLSRVTKIEPFVLKEKVRRGHKIYDFAAFNQSDELVFIHNSSIMISPADIRKAYSYYENEISLVHKAPQLRISGLGMSLKAKKDYEKYHKETPDFEVQFMRLPEMFEESILVSVDEAASKRLDEYDKTNA